MQHCSWGWFHINERVDRKIGVLMKTYTVFNSIILSQTFMSLVKLHRNNKRHYFFFFTDNSSAHWFPIVSRLQSWICMSKRYELTINSLRSEMTCPEVVMWPFQPFRRSLALFIHSVVAVESRRYLWRVFSPSSTLSVLPPSSTYIFLYF